MKGQGLKVTGDECAAFSVVQFVVFNCLRGHPSIVFSQSGESGASVNSTFLSVGAVATEEKGGFNF